MKTYTLRNAFKLFMRLHYRIRLSSDKLTWYCKVSLF